MFDLLLLAVIVLPLLAANLVSVWLCRDFAQITAEERAQRIYRLSWIVNACVPLQMGLTVLTVDQWGAHMPIAIALGEASITGIRYLMARMSEWIVMTLVISAVMLAMGINYLVLSKAVFRATRLARGYAATTGLNESRLSLRSFAGSVVPIIAWVVLVNAGPGDLPHHPTLLGMGLIGFVLIQFVLAPFFIQLSHPTEPLNNAALTGMSVALCQSARVPVCAIRLLKFGEFRIANALVCGLLPWYRRIFVSDRMVETFSAEEIQAILAHEIGHIKHGHLWWYSASRLSVRSCWGP